MSCGMDRGCIEARIRETMQRFDGEGLAAAERRLVAEMNAAHAGGRTDREADGALDRDEVDYIVRMSRATSGSGFVHNRVVAGMMDALDPNRDGRITAAEFNARRR